MVVESVANRDEESVDCGENGGKKEFLEEQFGIAHLFK